MKIFIILSFVLASISQSWASELPLGGCNGVPRKDIATRAQALYSISNQLHINVTLKNNSKYIPLLRATAQLMVATAHLQSLVKAKPSESCYVLETHRRLVSEKFADYLARYRSVAGSFKGTHTVKLHIKIVESYKRLTKLKFD